MLLQLRSYKHKNSSSPEEIATEWSQNETAVIVVDLWDNHWCRSTLEQIRELVPRVEKFLTVVRNSGVLVIHAPTNVHDFYRRYLQRKRVIDMKETYLKDKKIKKVPSRKHYRPSESQPLYMGKENGCLDVPTPAHKLVWKRQATGITIAKDDLILRNDRQELLGIVRSKKLTNLIYVGVAANSCILKRAIGLISMSEAGFGRNNLAICRDLTEVQYNPKQPPFVTSIEALNLQISFIEKLYASSLECRVRSNS